MSLFKASLNEESEEIKVEIKVDDLKVLTSGTVFSSNGKTIKIMIDDVDINFNFIDDIENEKTRINTKIIDEKKVNINLINFNSSIGQGKIVPTLFMYTNNLDIYMSYIVNTLNRKEKHRKITYTIYYGESKWV